MIRRPTEAQCQTTIVHAARRLGFLVHHARAALRASGGHSTPLQGDRGFPDLVICGHGRVLIVELKRHPNKVDERQHAWHRALTVAGVDTRVVWVPEGQQPFLDDLVAIAGKSPR